MLGATLAILAERGFDGLELPGVALRAGVNASTVYRRWGSKTRLVGEALLERGRPLSPTPDTGALRTDLERLLLEGGALLRTPAVRALFEVLLSESGQPAPEVAHARDRFFSAHLVEAGTIVERAIARSELETGTDPGALIELVIGPALLRSLFMGLELDPPAVAAIVARAEAALVRQSRFTSRAANAQAAPGGGQSKCQRMSAKP
ncbi:MAG TPA: TetR/AcrR family transcriptional regulator [Chloroflexota bacterium]|nr:TetR/AcrR family transcriptional regulator [Chloroflexota bacterium]